MSGDESSLTAFSVFEFKFPCLCLFCVCACVCCLCPLVLESLWCRSLIAPLTPHCCCLLALQLAIFKRQCIQSEERDIWDRVMALWKSMQPPRPDMTLRWRCARAYATGFADWAWAAQVAQRPGTGAPQAAEAREAQVGQGLADEEAFQDAQGHLGRVMRGWGSCTADPARCAGCIVGRALVRLSVFARVHGQDAKQRAQSTRHARSSHCMLLDAQRWCCRPLLRERARGHVTRSSRSMRAAVVAVHTRTHR